MRSQFSSLALTCGLVALAMTAGCQGPRRVEPGVRTGSRTARSDSQRSSSSTVQSHIRRVICLFDQKPWLNLDVAGDSDPEGVHFRVFLDAGDNKGVHRDGTLRVEMYHVDRVAPGAIQRTLVSDWEWPTSRFQPIRSKVLCMGYHVRLVWAKKSIAGREVELITQYSDTDGNTVRSGTKRLRVPKYSS